MGKQSGLGDNFYVGGFDLSLDVSAIGTMSGPLATLDVTGIKQLANARIGGLHDGDWQITSFLDVTSTPPYWVDNLHTLPLSDVIATYFINPMAVGSPAACIQGVEIDYAPTRDTSGNLSLATEIQSDGHGMEWGQQATAGLRTDGSATTGTAFQAVPSATTLGAQAYLQLVAFTGTSVDVQVQHSATSGGTYATLIDFGAQTAIGAFRGVSTGSVNPWIKVNTVGTFSHAVFAVMLNVNQIQVGL